MKKHLFHQASNKNLQLKGSYHGAWQKTSSNIEYSIITPKKLKFRAKFEIKQLTIELNSISWIDRGR